MFSIAGLGPYATVLGADLAALHPRLRAYFGGLPDGCEGVGRGVYAVAGLRRRVLRPLFAVLARGGIAFPEHGVDIPFEIRNTPTAAGAVRAVRTFRFAGATRTMVDETRAVDGILIDRIGGRVAVEAALVARVDRGGLVLESVGLALRWGAGRMPLPPLLKIILEERADDDPARGQRVHVRVVVPGLGEVYGYRGSFAYEIRAVAGAGTVGAMDEPEDADGGAAHVVRFCRHRSQGRRCTRPLGHPGLHRHRAILWSDAGSDPARCEGSGEPGVPAAMLADGYPDGRALCARCRRFMPLDAAGRLAPHDASDEGESDAEVSRRRAWLNDHGW